MPDHLNWMDQIRKRTDDELKNWTEEITDPQLLSLAMAELSLRSAKRLKTSLDEFSAVTERNSRRIAGLTRALILLSLALIVVALPPAVSTAMRLLRGEPQPASALAPPVRAEAAAVPLETQCSAQAEKATDQFAKRQREIQMTFKVLSAENHFNKKLHKCFVEVRTFGGEGDDTGFGNYVLDAYENSMQVYCLTPVRPTPGVRLAQCYDRKSNFITKEDADQQILKLMEQ
jgi:hypothetical protein